MEVESGGGCPSWEMTYSRFAPRPVSFIERDCRGEQERTGEMTSHSVVSILGTSEQSRKMKTADG